MARVLSIRSTAWSTRPPADNPQPWFLRQPIHMEVIGKGQEPGCFDLAASGQINLDSTQCHEQ